MDGTGKDTLITELIKFKSKAQKGKLFTLHDRPCTSEGGPISALSEWVTHDMATIHLQAPSIYNRHPLISEPIYGPRTRGYLRGRFRIPGWQREQRIRLQSHAFTIFCAPPWTTVEENLGKGKHMAGVVEHARELYEDYQYAILDWDGPKMTYNYTTQLVSDVLHRVAMLFGELER
jgi:hypothetical protein